MKNESYKTAVPETDKLKCLICNSEFITPNERNKHFKMIHNITYEKYIIEMYFSNEYPMCKCGCGNKMIFIDTPFGKWFNDYCKNHFPRKSHSEETKHKIKNNSKQAIIEKYGVSNIMQLDSFKEQIKKTKLERYGNKNYNNTIKQKETKLKRYGNENYNNPEQISKTKLEK